jgi:hypothetical protein
MSIYDSIFARRRALRCRSSLGHVQRVLLPRRYTGEFAKTPPRVPVDELPVLSRVDGGVPFPKAEQTRLAALYRSSPQIDEQVGSRTATPRAGDCPPNPTPRRLPLSRFGGSILSSRGGCSPTGGRGTSWKRPPGALRCDFLVLSAGPSPPSAGHWRSSSAGGAPWQGRRTSSCHRRGRGRQPPPQRRPPSSLNRHGEDVGLVQPPKPPPPSQGRLC